MATDSRANESPGTLNVTGTANVSVTGNVSVAGGLTIERVPFSPAMLKASQAVRVYLEESALPIETVWRVLNLVEWPDGPHATEKLTPAEQNELATLERERTEAITWAISWRMACVQAPRGQRPPRMVNGLLPPAPWTETEIEAVCRDLAALSNVPLDEVSLIAIEGTPIPDPIPTTTPPDDTDGVLYQRVAHYADGAHRVLALRDKCQLTREELAARIAATLTRPDGTRAVAPHDWMAARGMSVDDFQAGLYVLDIQEAKEAQKHAEQRAEDLEKELAKRPPVLSIRQGRTFLRALNTDAKDIAKARRKRKELSADQEEARRLFVFQPLGWAEVAVLTTLANIARDEGILEGHESALSTVRVVQEDKDTGHVQDAPRVRVKFPGFAAIAKRAGAAPGKDGRIPKEKISSLETALKNLTTVPRWIPEPILIARHKKPPIEDIRVKQTLWVEATTTFLGEETSLDLHPVAVASMLRAYVDHGPGLLAQWDSARRAIGISQMRDDLAMCEGYLRQLAGAQAGEATRHPHPAPNGATAGTQTLRKDLYRRTLWEKMQWDVVSKRKGRKEALAREQEALAFCRERGVLVGWTTRKGKEGVMLVLTLAHPGMAHTDPAQGLLFVDGGLD